MPKKNVSPNSGRSTSQRNTSRPQLATKSRNYIIYEKNLYSKQISSYVCFEFFSQFIQIKRKEITHSAALHTL